MALDGVLDDGATLRGGKRRAVPGAARWTPRSTGTRPRRYSSPGRPTERFGLRPAAPTAMTGSSASDVDRIAFDGAEELPMLPIEWTVDPEPAGPDDATRRCTPGTGDNLDRAIVREVDVPAGSPELTFDGMWSLEDGFDYGYVQVSTDGGVSYDVDPLFGPGRGARSGSAFNGESDGFVGVSCDLSAWAGQTIVIGVPPGHRLAACPSTACGSTTWRSTGPSCRTDPPLDGWQSPTQFNPIDVAGVHAAARRVHRRPRAGLDARRSAGLRVQGRDRGRRARPGDRARAPTSWRRSSPTTTRPRPCSSTRPTRSAWMACYSLEAGASLRAA